jgi:hypothetical protein
MMKAVQLIIFLLACVGQLRAFPEDSIKRKSQLQISPRFNTAGMAPVSGTIINTHANVDVTLTYVKNRFALNFANAVDLEDQRSEMNYFFINVRYRLSLTRKLSMSPFMAFYSEHAHQLFDRGSDANAGMLLSLEHKRMRIEAFALFVRITHAADAKDAINRLEVKYNLRYLTVSGFVYHNARYFDSRERVCIGFKVAMPEFPIANNLRARSDITGSFKAYEYPKTSTLSGVFLSLVLPMSY